MNEITTNQLTTSLNEQHWQVNSETVNTLYPPTTEEEIYNGDYELVLGRLKYYLHNDTPIPIETIKQFYRRFSSEIIKYAGLNYYEIDTTEENAQPDTEGTWHTYIRDDNDPDPNSTFKSAATKFMDDAYSMINYDAPIVPNIENKLGQTIPHTIKSESWNNRLTYYAHDIWTGKTTINKDPDPTDTALAAYQYNEGHDDFTYDYDPSMSYLMQACHTLSDQSKTEIIEMYLDQKNTPEGQKLISYEPLSKAIHYLIKGISQPELKTELWAKVIQNHLKSPDSDYIDFFYLVLTDEQGVLSSIASDKLSDTEVEQFITAYIQKSSSGDTDYSFASILNAIRKTIDTSDVQSNPNFKRLEKIMHRLLGTSDDKPLHLNLESVYQAIDFDSYPKNQEAQAQEEAILRKTLEGHGTIVSLAQGTGRFLELYKQLGYSNIIGIDISPTNLQTALEKPVSQDYLVNLIQGNWEKIPLANESVDAVECIGRNLPHVENAHNLNHVIKEVNRICKHNATVIVDFPNPEVGEYQQAVKSTRERLREFNVSEFHIEETWSIVDSPDDHNYYNRFTPPPEHVIRTFEQHGFTLISQKIASIPGMPEDQNIYFLFKKNDYQTDPSK